MDEVDFLNWMYKSTQVIIDSIENVIEKVNDEKFYKLLKINYNEYIKIKITIEDIMKKYVSEEEKISSILKLYNLITKEIALSKNNSVSRIAKLLLEETNKILIELLQKKNLYKGKEFRIIVLFKKYKRILEKNMINLKKYI